jgi:endonuclease YncB( thermonuclease family)
MPGGLEARANLTLMLPVNTRVVLTSVKDDKYGGRMDAVITLADGRDLATVLVEESWAVAWNGVGKAPLPPWPRGE